MFDLQKIFGTKINAGLKQKQKVAAMLKADPEKMRQFEEVYAVRALSFEDDSLFGVNAKQAASWHEGIEPAADPADAEAVRSLSARIENELLHKTSAWIFDGRAAHEEAALAQEPEKKVLPEEIAGLPAGMRPQLTGGYAIRDASPDGSGILLDTYLRYRKETDPEKKQLLYGMFRQGVDILDIDPIIYAILGMNRASIGHWLPKVVKPALSGGFLKVPATTVIKVPPTLLQLSRCAYEALNRVTLDIVDSYCRKAFRLDLKKDYFIKTGVFSSKFDFRNAHVHGAKEVRELGEYLLFISNQASQMAGPFSGTSIYGAATTNEWTVREFIQDKEGNPCIYKGLPLHTEYRVFADFDTGEVLGMSPYWEPGMMERRFGSEGNPLSPHDTHDYITFLAHKDAMMGRYEENKGKVRDAVRALARDTEGLYGQWSVDIMQNGTDFWLIDMALAEYSALNGCVPAGMLKHTEEEWLPDLSGGDA